MKKLMKKLIN